MSQEPKDKEFAGVIINSTGRYIVANAVNGMTFTGYVTWLDDPEFPTTITVCYEKDADEIYTDLLVSNLCSVSYTTKEKILEMRAKRHGQN